MGWPLYGPLNDYVCSCQCGSHLKENNVYLSQAVLRGSAGRGCCGIGQHLSTRQFHVLYWSAGVCT